MASASPPQGPGINTTLEAESETGGNSYNMQPFIVLYSMCILFILIGNVLIAVIILRTPLLRRNYSNMFLLSLVIARACIGVLVVPGEITAMFSEAYLGSVFCRLCHYFGMASGACSVFSITVIAIINWYFKTRAADRPLMTKPKSAVVIFLIWGVSFVYSIRQPVMFDLIALHVSSGDKIKQIVSCDVRLECESYFRIFTLIDFILLFVTPLATILFCHIKVLSKLEYNPRKNTAEVHMPIVLVSLCSAPPYIFQLICHWGSFSVNNADLIGIILKLISFSNGWINVIVCLVYRKDVRTGFSRIFRTPMTSQVQEISICK